MKISPINRPKYKEPGVENSKPLQTLALFLSAEVNGNCHPSAFFIHPRFSFSPDRATGHTIAPPLSAPPATQSSMHAGVQAMCARRTLVSRTISTDSSIDTMP